MDPIKLVFNGECEGRNSLFNLPNTQHCIHSVLREPPTTSCLIVIPPNTNHGKPPWFFARNKNAHILANNHKWNGNSSSMHCTQRPFSMASRWDEHIPTRQCFNPGRAKWQRLLQWAMQSLFMHLLRHVVSTQDETATRRSVHIQMTILFSTVIFRSVPFLML